MQIVKSDGDADSGYVVSREMKSKQFEEEACYETIKSDNQANTPTSKECTTHTCCLTMHAINCLYTGDFTFACLAYQSKQRNQMDLLRSWSITQPMSCRAL